MRLKISIAFLIDVFIIAVACVIIQFVCINKQVGTILAASVMMTGILCKDTFKNQSIGKKLMGVYVESTTHKNITIRQHLIRNLILCLWPLEGVLIVLTKDRRLGDYLAQTVHREGKYMVKNQDKKSIILYWIVTFLISSIILSCILRDFTHPLLL